MWTEWTFFYECSKNKTLLIDENIVIEEEEVYAPTRGVDDDEEPVCDNVPFSVMHCILTMPQESDYRRTSIF